MPAWLAGAATRLLPTLGRNLLAGVGIGSIVMYLLSENTRNLCIGYDVAGVIALGLWITQRGIHRNDEKT